MGEAASTSAREALLTAWIERNIGRIVRIELQPRWRLAWAVDVERDGQVIPLYVKGPREVEAMVPVRLEGAALRLLNENGIPAPRQYGYCAEIDAIVMERLPGDSRLENIADPAERDIVVDEYVAAMAAMHRLDPGLFAAEGFPLPRDPAAARLSQFAKIEAQYLARKRGPEACNEFLRLWIRRSLPQGPVEPAFITGDAFQMMYHQGHLQAVMDLEMACIGDPLLDLACIRMRDLSEKTGTASRIAGRYEQLSGRPLEYAALSFHLASIATASSLLISEVMASPAPETDYFEYYVYYHGSLRVALEAVAEAMGVTLDPIAEPVATGTSDSIHLGMLAIAVEQMPARTDMERYQQSKALAEIAFLERRDRYGAALDAEYRAELGAILPSVPADFREAEAALEAFVQAAAPEWDERLVRVLHRQALRQCFLADIPQNTRLRRFLRESIARLR